MATTEATARIRENALRSLKDSGSHIAARLGIEPPTFEFYRDKDYQQAQELKALAEFNTRLLNALQTQSQGRDDAQLSSTTPAKRGSHRTAVSER